MPEYISVDQFIDLMKSDRTFDLFDVRSPSEYEQASVPGAINTPLLSDEIRKIVGITYKKEGKEAAVQKGFELVGPDFHNLVREVKARRSAEQLVLYCWRGGMRSRIMSWLLETSGIPNVIVEGGYKSYRTWCLLKLKEYYRFLVIGGSTGSGKTLFLHELKKSGETVIDLEGMANHRGSAFGALGLGKQPSVEYFENMLALELCKIPSGQIIWLENESRTIGSVKLPDNIYEQIRSAEVISINAPMKFRKEVILNEYGNFPKEQLAECTTKLKKKLGGARLQEALDMLNEDNLEAWLEILLDYYDENYQYSNNKRDKSTIHILEAPNGITKDLIQESIQIKSKLQDKILV